MQFRLNPDTLAALREFDPPGESDFFSEIIRTYLTDTDQRIRKLRAAHGAGDADTFMKTAHAIKGSSLNVGADGFASLMDSLEKAGKSGSPGNPAEVAEAETIFAEVRAALAALLSAQ